MLHNFSNFSRSNSFVSLAELFKRNLTSTFIPESLRSLKCRIVLESFKPITKTSVKVLRRAGFLLDTTGLDIQGTPQPSVPKPPQLLSKPESYSISQHKINKYLIEVQGGWFLSFPSALPPNRRLGKFNKLFHNTDNLIVLAYLFFLLQTWKILKETNAF